MSEADQKEFLDTGVRFCGTLPNTGSTAGLEDSLVNESFKLFLYGVTIAAFGVSAEFYCLPSTAIDTYFPML